MAKPGKNAEVRQPSPNARTLAEELQRLRRSGLADLAMRPARFPLLNEAFARHSGESPRSLLTLLSRNTQVFGDLMAALPSPELRAATAILFHARNGSTPPPLDQRRRIADKLVTGREYAREPDTIQRHLEREVIDPLIIDVLRRWAKGKSPPLVQPATVLDTDAWFDDLERVAVCLNRQDFTFASILLDRWLSRGDPNGLDARGLHLRGRSLILLGNMQRDQGRVTGPLSARKSYDGAHHIFTQLDDTRRSAQAELLIAVTEEMIGSLDQAAASYATLSADSRLTPLDRARAGLWLGTTLTKQNQVEPAMRAMELAATEFEDLEEPEEWTVSHQKLALGHLAAGDPARATRCIELALSGRREGSPLQRVRFDTAHAHVMLGDPATINTGVALLDEAELTASRYGLSHQLRSIRQIRRGLESPVFGTAKSSQERP